MHPTPVQKTSPGSKVYIFDMGQIATGWVHLHLTGLAPSKAGLTIRMRQDEMQNGTGTSAFPYSLTEGNGFVDVFDTDGNFIQRVASRGTLNSPWGLVFAPADFGRFSNDLLVGNFGDGRINAYRQEGDHFHFHGQLRGPDGKRLTIDGLWALRFGNGGAAGLTNNLFFTAGINDEADGLFGSIRACQTDDCTETP